MVEPRTIYEARRVVCFVVALEVSECIVLEPGTGSVVGWVYS